MQHNCSQTHRSVSTHDHTYVATFTVLAHRCLHTCTAYAFSNRQGASTHTDTCMCTTLHSVHTHRPTYNAQTYIQHTFYTQRHMWAHMHTHTHSHTQLSGCLPFRVSACCHQQGTFQDFDQFLLNTGLPSFLCPSSRHCLSRTWLSAVDSVNSEGQSDQEPKWLHEKGAMGKPLGVHGRSRWAGQDRSQGR